MDSQWRYRVAATLLIVSFLSQIESECTVCYSYSVAEITKRLSMAKQTYPIPKSNPNAQMSIAFFILWLVNGVIIALANSIFPEQIVLGTMSLSHTVALVLSSGVLAWIATLVMPVFTEIEIRKQMVLSPQHWLLGYLLVGVLSLWAISRAADVFGLGLASWVFVLGLAAVLDFAQGMAMMLYGDLNKKK